LNDRAKRTTLRRVRPPCRGDREARRTNAFSKKVENHVHSLALFTTYYNFVRVHKTLRMSPAMAAGVADRRWEVADIVKLVEASEAKPAKRGPYKKRIAG
jgi:hypothetical protein